MTAETVNCQDEAGPKMLDFCLNYVSTHENCVTYLFEHGLLRTQSICDNCGICMSLVKKTQKNDTSDGFLWRCKDCLSTHSIRNDSVFAMSKLPLTTLLQITYLFAMDMQVYQVEKFVSVSHTSVIKWFDILRSVCKESLKQDKMELGESLESGTVDISGTVEIDESLFGKKRKYNRGTGKQDTWVFGMVEKGTRKAILKIVDKRNKETLLPIIQDHVRDGSRIHSDCWAAYSCLQKHGYVHSTVNHTQEFKADDGTCTNEIEGLWGMVKGKIKKMKGVVHHRIDVVLDEFMYRYRYGKPNGDIYARLLQDLKEFRPSS